MSLVGNIADVITAIGTKLKDLTSRVSTLEAGGGGGTTLTRNHQTGDYTLASTDNGAEVQIDSASLQTVTLDPSSLPLPFECWVRQLGIGPVRYKPKVDLVAGDLLLFLNYTRASAVPGLQADSLPQLVSAFTASMSSPATANLLAATRVVDGSETKGIFGGSCNGNYTCVCLLIRDADATTPVEAHNIDPHTAAVTSPATMTASAITTLSDNALVVFLASLVNAGTLDRDSVDIATPAGFNKHAMLVPTASGSCNLLVASKIQAAKGTTGAVTTTGQFTAHSGNTGYMAGLLSIKPAAGKVARVLDVSFMSAEQSAASWYVPAPRSAKLQFKADESMSTEQMTVTRVRCFDGCTLHLDRSSA